MKGFFIEVTNNLLDPKHRKRMGTAVWEFMWCLDKITKIDENQIGWVCGGNPINLKDIQKEIGITESKISRNLHKLEKEGYIEIINAPYGIIIKVAKAKKRFAIKDTRFALKGKPIYVRQYNDNNNNSMSDKPTNWNFNDEIEKLLKDKQRHIQVIGVWMYGMKLQPENKEQFQSIIKRNLRPAKLLEGYNNEDILETIKVLRNTTYLTKFTLETVSKFIDEVISNKKKEGPKIVRYEQVKKSDGKIVMRPIYEGCG